MTTPGAILGSAAADVPWLIFCGPQSPLPRPNPLEVFIEVVFVMVFFVVVVFVVVVFAMFVFVMVVFVNQI